mgnify:FL=1
MNLREVVDDSVLHLDIGSGGVGHNVVSQVLLLTWGTAQHVVQVSSLLELSIGGLPVEWTGSAFPDLLVLLKAELLGGEVVGSREVVWCGAQVTVDLHGTVTDVWVELASDRAVDWDLLVVDSQAVSVGVWVREQSRLKNWVSRWLHVWHRVRRRECNLLNLSEVVLWVLVQSELTESSQRVLLLRPDLGQVKHREVGLLSLLSSHCLNVTRPGWEVTLGNVLEQVLLCVVRVRASQLTSLLVGQSVEALVTLQVHLDVVPVAVLGRPLVSVARVAVHLSVRSGGTTVREQNHHLVHRFLVANQVVPEHVGVFQVRLWVSLLSVNEVGELSWVSEEKHRGVVVDKVQVTLLRVQFKRETSWVSGGIWRAGLTAHSGKSGHQLGLFANSVQKFGRANVGNVVGHLELTVSAGTLGVHDTLWDSFTVKVGKRVNQVEVLQQQRTMLANSLGGEWVGHGAAVSVLVDRSHL